VSISVSNKQLFLSYFYVAAYFKLNIVLRQRVLFHCRIIATDFFAGSEASLAKR